MKVENQAWFSPSLGHSVEMKIYGYQGLPVIAFPSSRGRFYDFENNGMIQSIEDKIEKGKITVFAVDSRDNDNWFSGKHPQDKVQAYEAYVRYITNEVHPFILKWAQRNPITTGCSFGAYQAINFFLRFPHMFSGCIGLSGVYNLKQFIGDFYNEAIYYNEPESFMSNLTDIEIINQINEGTLIFAVGQGPWEDETGCLQSSRHLAEILLDKGIKHWFDQWGNDVSHDWLWWRKMLPYFLDKFKL